MITETPTATPTETPTATPTLNYYVETTTPAGEPARIVREIRPYEQLNFYLLLAILISIWLFYIRDRLKGDRNVG